MARRFGRNQKRQLQAQITSARMAAIRAGETVELVEKRRRLEVEELGRQVRAARMARDTIRIDIDSLVDPRERNIHMRASFENMSKRSDVLHAAIDFDHHRILNASDVERNAFIKMIGEQVAEHALHQIMRHWRSR